MNRKPKTSTIDSIQNVAKKNGSPPKFFNTTKNSVDFNNLRQAIREINESRLENKTPVHNENNEKVDFRKRGKDFKFALTSKDISVCN